MRYEIHPHLKNENDKRTAFMEQIRAYEPDWFAIVVGSSDLIDRDGPVSLSNLPFNGYLLKLVDVIRYEDGQQLHPVPAVINTTDEMPQGVVSIGDAVHLEGLKVVEAGKRD